MRDPQALRERAGIDPDTRQDQYFLDDERVLDRCLSYAIERDFPFDDVLEIGPGTGALTSRLLTEARHLTAFERDRTLVEFLRTEFESAIAADQLTVVQGDATSDSLPSFDSCISNLPYGASSPILFRLLPLKRPLLLLVQREFGERMAASPGTDAYGRLSVSAQHFGTIEVLEIVPPTAFTPQPAVESAFVCVLPVEPSYQVDDEEFFLRLTKAIFTQRRKTLRNAIRNTTHISGIADAQPIIGALPDELLAKRPGTLAPDTFANIANVAYACRGETDG